ncbi:MAG: nucleoside recognition domain-containing protein [Bacteroidales bacterium]|nr:nucleoside recognition domain-containing protein [Bacteroidales bacterium]
MDKEAAERFKQSLKDMIPGTVRTCVWMVKITVGVSFAMMLLKYFNILPWISEIISPVFKYFGLPGSAALAYLSGYFVNCYSAIAVITSLGLDWRATTIIATMVLCSHSMVLETAVQKKTGASGTRMVVVRTLSALVLGLLLNWFLPGTSAQMVDAAAQKWTLPLGTTLWQWAVSTLKLVALMVTVIFSLNFLQRLLTEYGIMDKIAKVFTPLMKVFGLPSNTTFLWLVANVVGLGYGAAVMLDEIGRGRLSDRDVKLLDSHICVNHSNVEDLTLMTAIGGVWWIMLSVRLLAAAALVWEHRLEMHLSSAS